MELFSDELKKVLLAGVGAIALTAEKSKEMVDTLVKKGELTVDQGKILNEELKHTIKNQFKTSISLEDVSSQLDKLSPEDLAVLKEKIEKMQQEEYHEESK